jgi:membrane protein YqaA with SNARE-associated domain
MLRRLYSWTMRLAEGPHALRALAVVSFAESSFFPVPPDTLLIPMVLAQRQRAFTLAAWCTAASVAGGMVGYAIGSLLYESLGLWIVNFYGYGNGIETFRESYAAWGAWIILLKGMTPIPYKLVTIASGFAGYNFGLFVILSIITRGIRFFLVAGLLAYYGEPIRGFLERRLEAIALATVAIIISGFVIVRYVV